MSESVKLSNIIAPAFYGLHHDIQEHRHTHYWIAGGRGSTKSSFVPTEIGLLLKKYPNISAVALRKVKDTIRDSIYAQTEWAVDMLNMTSQWRFSESTLRARNVETGQQILFKGTDDKVKLKSLKVKRGYIGIIWFEEFDQFTGMAEIRNILQSLMRGGNRYWVFYTYNQPKSRNAWVNAEAVLERPDRIYHTSTYLTVPRTWLGEQFFIEAEHLKKLNPPAYANEYLGQITGSGGAVFDNVTLRDITEDEIYRFPNVVAGIDWGFAVDPFCWGAMYLDMTRRKLYIFDEIWGLGLSNRAAAAKIKEHGGQNYHTTADSAELKSIGDMRDEGIECYAAQKGPGSIRQGMKFLQRLTEIVIDPKRCPNIAREFNSYEYARNKDGEFISEFPDKDNHSIDMTRYAIEREMLRRGNIV